MSEEAYARIMQQLAQALGVKWESDADTHALIVVAKRVAARAREFQALSIAIRSDLERYGPRD